MLKIAHAKNTSYLRSATRYSTDYVVTFTVTKTCPIKTLFRL